MTLKWDEITVSNQQCLEQVYELYDSAFPREVREPHHIFLKGLQYAVDSEPNHFRLLIGMDGNEMVSFATGHYLADVNTGFIVYIATNSSVRSMGLGSKTLLKLEELLNKDAIRAGNPSINVVVLETETIDMVHTEKEKEDCLKRAKFFERNHYERCEHLYLQPPLHPGESEVPLHLYMKHVRNNKINEHELHRIIRAIYQEKYLSVNEIEKAVLNGCLQKMNLDEQLLL